MSKEEKYTRENPGSFEDKIDTAMADLEMEPEEEFYGADFYAEEDEEQEDYPEEYPEEEEYDSEEDLSDKFSRDIMTDATKELQVELIQPHSRNRRKRSGTVGPAWCKCGCAYRGWRKRSKEAKYTGFKRAEKESTGNKDTGIQTKRI